MRNVVINSKDFCEMALLVCYKRVIRCQVTNIFVILIINHDVKIDQITLVIIVCYLEYLYVNVLSVYEIMIKISSTETKQILLSSL